MSQEVFLETKLLSSLVKVFPGKELNCREHTEGSMLGNEVYSFQLAYKWKGPLVKNVRVRIESELSPFITVRKVGLIPSEMPCYADHDDNVLSTEPGLYPDILLPVDGEGLVFLPYQWRSVWITIEPCNLANPGSYPVEIIFEIGCGEVLAKRTFHVRIINANLPKQTLIHTEWFHTDCLSTWYKAEVFGNRYWDLVDKYIKTAVRHGINMILTPLFTPPLDTEIGGERPTVQLVDVQKDGSSFRFGYDNLKKWIDICLKNGVEYFEMSHLFTQWGARHAPKIMACEDGEYKKIFGWETNALGKEYKCFLDQFLPSLVDFISKNNLNAKTWFHVSDEPLLEDMEYYKRASMLVSGHLKDFPVIDALSGFEFYKSGLIRKPIPSLDHIDAFLENNVQNLWTYYCCGQYKEVSNRFFNMPSARNRILGMQLYKYGIEGFLHWGYNFWYSQKSRYPVDPFSVTDAGYAFPSGDAFLVYPGDNGPLESLRMEVFFEALQDMRALSLLEQFAGKAEVVKMLEEGLDSPITFKRYPKDADWLINKREEINSKISEFCR
ncbi:MAG TPA: DUF4091 domain-containing protein [Clostridiaceae bacterium]|nr:DUF4091 domain-containing protein [Clostridiaceae bacterium]